MKYDENGYSVEITNLNTNVKTKYTNAQGDYIYWDDSKKEVYYANKFKITQDLTTGITTKLYDYHPFIIKEVLSGTSKQVFYKDRFAKWRGYSSLIYESNQVSSVVDLLGNTVNVIIDPLKDSIYFPGNSTYFTRTMQDMTTYYIKTEKYDSPLWTKSYIFSNSTSVETLEKVVEKYVGYTVTNFKLNNTQLIQSDYYYMEYPDVTQPSVRYFEKKQATSFKWNYVANKQHNFNPMYNSIVY